MTTLDLNTQCALAQGWTMKKDMHPYGLSEEVVGIDLWVNDKGETVTPVVLYTPSNDLNQAVTFAAWGCRALDGRYLDSEGRERRFHEIRISWCGDGSGEIEFDADDGKGFEPFRVFHNSNQLAEALCRATLTALGKEEAEHDQ